MMEDTDKLCSMQDVIMSQAMPPFAKLFWPLFKVFIGSSVTFCETRNWYLHGEHNFEGSVLNTVTLKIDTVTYNSTLRITGLT